jgi:hypothetical protein
MECSSLDHIAKQYAALPLGSKVDCILAVAVCDERVGTTLQ